MTPVRDPFAIGVARLAALVLGLLALQGFATAYWGFVRAEGLAARPDNPRRIAFDQQIRRGRLLDRAGTELAVTRFDADSIPSRVYPEPAAAPVTGYQTWRYGAGSVSGASYGAGGAEAAYDAALRGDLGSTIGQVLATRVLGRPQVGHDVVLTLDAALQATAADALAGREGAVVVLDVADGAVRALVSQPTFDPAALDDGLSLPNEASSPLFNRATQGRYPPGSTFKTITLAAALAAGATRLDAVVADGGGAVEMFEGYAVRCANEPDGVERFDIAHAFAYSCNLTFARLGRDVGRTAFERQARAFGIDAAPPFPLPTAAGQISNDGAMPLPELVSAAFGQGEVLATPLHMALVAAAAAGDGRIPTPYLLADVPGVRWRSIGDERGTWRRAMGASVAGDVRRAMITAAEVGYVGTAQLAGGPRVGGKTGTAQAADGLPHAWFIGFAPAEAPRVAVAVLVVHGGEGIRAAAPIAGRVLAAALAADGASATMPVRLRRTAAHRTALLPPAEGE